MRTLTYWIADHLTDHACYSVRARTRRELKERLATFTPSEREDLGKPRKVVIRYKDAFDLVCHLTREGGGEGTPDT